MIYNLYFFDVNIKKNKIKIDFIDKESNVSYGFSFYPILNTIFIKMNKIGNNKQAPLIIPFSSSVAELGLL